jgi:molybdate transport system substrate-binding protein
MFAWRTVAVLATVLAAAPLLPAQEGARGDDGVVRVAAAADLRFALDEAAAQLAARRPRSILRITYGSSGTLHAQIQQRAPYDVYLSADVAYPADLVAKGIGAAPDLFTYAQGRLVLWVPNGSPLPIDRDGLRSLDGAARVAIANPAHAPYGRAAQAALERAGIWNRLQRRLVLGDNIAQTAQFVESGAADAGLIAKSLAAAAGMRDQGRWWEIPGDAYPPLVQGGLILRTAGSRDAALALRDYLLSQDGQQLLARHGFGLPPR